MAIDDKIKAELKKTEGKLQSAAGELTGNNKQKLEGEAKQVHGAALEAKGKVKDSANDLIDGD